MDIPNIAAENMRSGFNCAQAVVKAFAGEVGLESEEEAVRMATALGGGIGRHGMVCGAVSGACLILGYRFGVALPGNPEAREKTNRAVGRLIAAFKGEFSTVQCRELVGEDMTDPEGYARARAKGIFQNQCPVFVAAAGKYLEQILAEG